MYIPMETLSFTATRTDSGTGARQASEISIDRANARFEKIFENELNRHDDKMQAKKRNPDGDTGIKRPVKGAKDYKTNGQQQKPKDPSKLVEEQSVALAAGVMGTETNEDVIILEGDKESVATPEMRIDTEMEPPAIDTTVDAENNVTANIGEKTQAQIEAKTEIKADTYAEVQAKAQTAGQTEAKTEVKTEAYIEGQTEAKTDAQADVTNTVPKDEMQPFESVIHAETAGIEDTQDTEGVKPKPAAVQAETLEKPDTAGEVTARMPEIRTEDGQENNETNKESGKKFSDNGNLSPLENENEIEVKGQDEKTYADAVKAVKKKEEIIEERPVEKTEEDRKTSETKESKDSFTQPAKPVTTDTAQTTVNTAVSMPPLSEGIKPEAFKATQQMAQQAANPPVKPENLFEEMISRVERMQEGTKNSMTIQLNPEFLGKVALEVAIDTAGLHVKINAEDHGVRGMINGQLTALIESLTNKGIAVAGVEVVYTGINYNTFDEPHGEDRRHSGDHKQGKNREIQAKDGIAYYTMMPDLMDFYFDTGISSVEYKV